MFFFTDNPKLDDAYMQKTEKGKSEQYTIDDFLNVWYSAVYNGATLQIYCQEKNYSKEDFMRGVDKLMDELTKDKTGEALKLILSNNMVLLGTFEECVQHKEEKSQE